MFIQDKGKGLNIENLISDKRNWITTRSERLNKCNKKEMRCKSIEMNSKIKRLCAFICIFLGLY